MNLLKRMDYIKWWNIPGRITQAGRILKWSWQRITRGYADCDWWNFNSYISNLFSNALRSMKNGASHPVDMTSETWNAYLEEMAQLFYQCDESNDYYKNPAFDEYLDLDTDDPRRQELQEKFLQTSRDNFEKMEADKDKAFDMLKERFFDLWD